MKSFIKGVTDVTKNAVTMFEKAALVAVGQNPTLAEMEQVWRDFEKACHDAGYTSTDAARDEIKEHVTRHMQNGGMSKAQVEEWFEPKWKAVKDLGDKVRETVPKVEKAGRFMLVKFLGAIAVVGGVLTVISGVHRPVPEGEKMLAVTRRLDAITEEIKAAQAFEASEKEFNMMTGGLEVVQAAPLPESMPIVVAAKAEEPVIVKVTTPSGTRSFQSNVGQVYRNVPQEAKHEIARGLGEHRDQGFHKEFTVDSPIGSAHFKY